jgi:phage protein U
MYAQLGNIRFEGLIGFNTFTKRTEANYAEHARIDGKPRLQKIGDNLDTIRFDMQLHASFSNIEDDLAALRTAQRNGDVLPFVDGKGTLFGTFVIMTIDEMQSQTYKDGTPFLVNLSIELKEYADELTQAAQGFAAFGAKVNAFAQTRSNAGAVMEAARATTAASTSAGNHIDDAKSGKLGALKRAQNALKKVRDGLIKVQAALQTVKNVIQAKERIENNIERAKNSVSNALVAVQKGDINGAMEANRELQEGVSAMNGGLTEVAIISVTRIPS